MEKSHNDYVDLLSRLKLSTDFQSFEYYALTVSHLKRRDTTIEELNMCVKWQIDSMRAYSKQQMPPPPPPKVMEMMQQQARPPANVSMAGTVGQK